jgi:hypothetical protein
MGKDKPTPREQRIAARDKGAQRRRVREAAADQERRKSRQPAHPQQQPVEREPHPRVKGHERILADDGSVPIVQVTCFSLRGFQAHQRTAADRFGKDWEAALGALRSRGFEGAAGGTRSHADHLRRAAAQQRLVAIRRHVGSLYSLLVLAVIVGYGPGKISAECGEAVGDVSIELRRVLDRLAEFYDPSRRFRSRADMKAEKILARFAGIQALIDEAERTAG